MTPLDTAALYDAHAGFVWRLLLRLGTPREEVEDAVQEVFLTLHRRGSDFRHASSVRTFIAGIAVRVAKDQRRRHRRAAQKLSRLADEPTREPNNPHVSAEAAQAFALAVSLLEQLDEDQRTVFVLTEWEGLKGVEIAEITGANLNTVNSRLRRAREHFNALVATLKKKEALP